MNLGDKYTALAENIFVNKYWVDTNKKIYRRHFMNKLKSVFTSRYLNTNLQDDDFEFNLPNRYYKSLRQKTNNLDEIFKKDTLN